MIRNGSPTDCGSRGSGGTGMPVTQSLHTPAWPLFFTRENSVAFAVVPRAKVLYPPMLKMRSRRGRLDNPPASCFALPALSHTAPTAR